MVTTPFPISSSPVERLKAPGVLTAAWHRLRYHPVQHALFTSSVRYVVVPAGRRSGKTVIMVRKTVGIALCAHYEARFFLAAPTAGQAKRIFWRMLKELSPREFVAAKSEGEPQWIRYVNGAEIWVLGTDAPERIEGTPWDGGVLDEFANMKPDVWFAHLMPVMAEEGRTGWCAFIGVPEGRNHYYDLYRLAKAQDNARKCYLGGHPDRAADILKAAYGDNATEIIAAGVDGLEWAAYHWVSADILPADEIASARRIMPADLFDQEFNATFTAFRGRVYKGFAAETHTAPLAHLYNPKNPLVICLDFNVSPGIAAVCQEIELPWGGRGTGVIGEVYIPYDSTTEAVCRQLIREWEGHQGPLVLYGDATGGQRRTVASKQGATDWKIVMQVLRPVFPRIISRVPKSNPTEIDRVNCTNARILSAAGDKRLVVDPIRAPRMVEDLEGVRWLEGTREIAKSGAQNENLTHLTDGLGYYIASAFPIPDQSAAAGPRRYAVG